MGGADIAEAEELLDGADVVAVFEQVGGEGKAEGVAADALLRAARSAVWTARWTAVSW